MRGAKEDEVGDLNGEQLVAKSTGLNVSSGVGQIQCL